jgi:alanine-glyoxylate transaminase/serine-glyoxylate transaminase/serine-pyruvate transaminase
VSIPEGIDDGKVRRTLLNDYEIEIGGGLGEFAGKAWRVGLMGESARERNVFAVLSALETILSKEGYEVAFGASLSAAQRAIATFGE